MLSFYYFINYVLFVLMTGNVNIFQNIGWKNLVLELDPKRISTHDIVYDKCDNTDIYNYL